MKENGAVFPLCISAGVGYLGEVAVEAKISKTWKRRFYLLIAFMAATAGWFFYDGLIRYPHLNRGYEKHVELEQQGRADEWTELAAREGWPAKPQTEPLDIGQQYFFGGIAAAIALGIGVWVLISIFRSVRSDAEAVYGPTGRRVPFDAVRRIDMRKWDSKGIAVLHYEQGGRERKLIVDDYKYEGAAVILDEIKAYQQARRDQTGA